MATLLRILIFNLLLLGTISTSAQNSNNEFMHKISMGCNVYIVGNEETGILIDTGSHGKMALFTKALKSIGKTPEWIKYIVITHTHYDHVANLAEIKALTGAQVIIQKDEAKYIESGHTILPEGINGLGKIGVWFASKFSQKKTEISPVIPDIRVINKLDMHFTGLNIDLLHTPGHSDGSLSVIWNDSIVFCGDVAFVVLGTDPWPEVGEDPQLILNSWKILLNTGCKTFYPGHGRKITAKRLRKSLLKRINKTN